MFATRSLSTRVEEEGSGNEKRTPNTGLREDEEGGYSNCMEMNDNIDSSRALDVLDRVHNTPPLFQVGYVLTTMEFFLC